jgi:hypothetical protein
MQLYKRGYKKSGATINTEQFSRPTVFMLIPTIFDIEVKTKNSDQLYIFEYKNAILDVEKKVIIRTYAEEENFAIFRRSGSEFIILRIPKTEKWPFLFWMSTMYSYPWRTLKSHF